MKQLLTIALFALSSLTVWSEPGFAVEIKSNKQLWVTITNPAPGGSYHVEKSPGGTAFSGFVPLGQTSIAGKPVFVFSSYPAGEVIRVREVTNTIPSGLITNFSGGRSFVTVTAMPQDENGARQIDVVGPPGLTYTIQSAPTVNGPWIDRILGEPGQTNFVDNLSSMRFYRAKFSE